MKNKKQYLKAGGMLSTFVLGVVVSVLVLQGLVETTVVQETIKEKRTWQSALGDNDPGSGVSGVINISLVKHGLYDYKVNITRNESMFAWSGYGGEANNTEIGINVPFGIKFDIVAKVRWNKTHMFNTTNNNWSWNWVRGNLSMPRFLYENYTLGKWNISSVGWEATQNFAFGHYVLGGGTHDGNGGAPGAGNNNGNAINRSERVPQCYFRFWAYY